MSQPSTFLLIHGAWCGGYVWRRVADRLQARGHRVFAPSLTGLADRSHLLGPDIGLATHVDDGINLMRWEELTNVILVGHSYGGMVISGMAEKAPPGAIRSIVYLDAFYAPNGRSVVDVAPLLAEALSAQDPVPFPFAGQTGDAWLEALVTPQPRRTLTDRPALTGARDRIPTKTYILATNPGAPWFAAVSAPLKQDPVWRYRELPCGHGTMLEMPDETTELLLEAAG
jgi:pimeloyl-ACP methyl ester carboxylesterase